MSRDNPTNVDAAFDILLEQIEADIDVVNRAGALAFEGRDSEAARATLEQAGQFIAFRDRTASQDGGLPLDGRYFFQWHDLGAQ